MKIIKCNKCKCDPFEYGPGNHGPGGILGSTKFYIFKCESPQCSDKSECVAINRNRAIGDWNKINTKAKV